MALSPLDEITEDHLRICKLLLLFRADCNARNNNGDRPLGLALKASPLAVCLLLENGASPQPWEDWSSSGA